MNSFKPSPFSATPVVVKNLLIINIIFFIATLAFKNIVIDGAPLSLIDLLGVHYFDSPKFRIWQVVTYMFMHGSFGHILFNMFALFTFGSMLEYTLGSKRFLNFYLITGLGALALQLLIQAIEVHQLTGGFTIDPKNFSSDLFIPTRKLAEIYFAPMVGASGAIFGLLVAFWTLYPDAELFILLVPIPMKAKYVIPIYILIELFLGMASFSGDSIAHFAHLGGALFGYILIKYWHLKQEHY